MSYTPRQIPTSGIFDSIKSVASSALSTAKSVFERGLAPTQTSTPVYVQQAPAPNYMPILLIGGAAVAAIYFLKKK